ncbi:MAG: hypothetical protein PVH64_10930 [Bacillota bacterium]
MRKLKNIKGFPPSNNSYFNSFWRVTIKRSRSPMKYIVFLVEEPSMKIFLNALLP